MRVHKQHYGYRVLLCFALGFCVAPALAISSMQDGGALLRMCQGADKVRALGVMCHSYLNGYLDTVSTYEKRGLPFCIGMAEKERVPGELVSWIRLHPDAEKEPAPAVLKKALIERFPCRRGR